MEEKEEIKKPYTAILVIFIFLAAASSVSIVILTPQSFFNSDTDPEYEVVGQRDMGLDEVVKLQVDAITSLGLPKGELVKVSENIVDEIISKRAVNAIAIRFWEHRDAMESKIAFATVVWAPYGDWNRALDVASGDYSAHDYNVKILRTASYEKTDGDSDGVPDSLDPLPDAYGTVTFEEYNSLIAVSQQRSEVISNDLNGLFRLYDSGNITKYRFMTDLDAQDESVGILVSELDLIPPKRYVEFNEYYFTSLFDLQNSVYYYKRYAKNGSSRDLYLARISIENYLKNVQRAKADL